MDLPLTNGLAPAVPSPSAAAAPAAPAPAVETGVAPTKAVSLPPPTPAAEPVAVPAGNGNGVHIPAPTAAVAPAPVAPVPSQDDVVGPPVQLEQPQPVSSPPAPAPVPAVASPPALQQQQQQQQQQEPIVAVAEPPGAAPASAPAPAAAAAAAAGSAQNDSFMWLTPAQAAERNRRLPKGYRLVPLDPVRAEQAIPALLAVATPLTAGRPRRERRARESMEIPEPPAELSTPARSTPSASSKKKSSSSAEKSKSARKRRSSAMDDDSEAELSDPEPTPRKKHTSTKSSPAASSGDHEARIEMLKRRLEILRAAKAKREAGEAPSTPAPSRKEPKTPATSATARKKRKKSEGGSSKRRVDDSDDDEDDDGFSTPARPAASRSGRKLKPAQPRHAGDLLPSDLQSCVQLLRTLRQQPNVHWFSEPVDAEKLQIPHYHTIIKQPMDLGTVQAKLTRSEYAEPEQFAEDVRLTFRNAMTFNPAQHPVHQIASKLLTQFDKRFSLIQARAAKARGEDLGDLSGGESSGRARKRAKTATPAASATKKETPQVRALQAEVHQMREQLARIQQTPGGAPAGLPPSSAAAVANKTKSRVAPEESEALSMREKRMLRDDILKLPVDMIEPVLEILSADNPDAGQDGQVTVDLDQCSNATLLKLQKYVKASVAKLKRHKRVQTPSQQLSPYGGGSVPRSPQQLSLDQDPADGPRSLAGNSPGEELPDSDTEDALPSLDRGPGAASAPGWQSNLHASNPPPPVGGGGWETITSSPPPAASSPSPAPSSHNPLWGDSFQKP